MMAQVVFTLFMLKGVPIAGKDVTVYHPVKLTACQVSPYKAAAAPRGHKWKCWDKDGNEYVWRSENKFKA